MSTADLHTSFTIHNPGDATKCSHTVANRETQVWNGAMSTMLIASLVALATSCYLAWSSLTSSPVAGCGGGSVFDCSHVLHSRWSTAFSIPVSIPAIATHMLIVGMLLIKSPSEKVQQIRWIAIGFASLAAGAAAVWFIGLQLFALGHLCPYCLVAHAGGLVLAAVFLLTNPINFRTLKRISAAVAFAMAGLIGTQLLTPPPQTYELIEYPQSPAAAGSTTSDAASSDDNELFAPPTSAILQSSLNGRVERWRNGGLTHLVAAIANPTTLLIGEVGVFSDVPTKTVQVLNGVKLSAADWPLIGNPDAELMFVEMFDYTCPHCQRTHQSLKGAKAKYGDRLAVMTLPVPLDGKCNPTVNSTHAMHREACEIAKLAVAFWTVDRDQFASFHDFLFESKPSYAQALTHASSLVDKVKLDAALESSVPADFIEKHVALYRKAGAGTIPKLLFPTTTAVGAIESSEAMTNLIERHARPQSR